MGAYSTWEKRYMVFWENIPHDGSDHIKVNPLSGSTLKMARFIFIKLTTGMRQSGKISNEAHGIGIGR